MFWLATVFRRRKVSSGCSTLNDRAIFKKDVAIKCFSSFNFHRLRCRVTKAASLRAEFVLPGNRQFVARQRNAALVHVHLWSSKEGILHSSYQFCSSRSDFFQFESTRKNIASFPIWKIRKNVFGVTQGRNRWTAPAVITFKTSSTVILPRKSWNYFWSEIQFFCASWTKLFH